MNNTKANKTSFSSDNQPQNKRGLSTKTLILNAIKKKALISVTDKSNNKDIEEALLSHIAERALNSDDSNSGMLLKLLSDKTWCNLKPTAEKITFDFDTNLKPSEQAKQVLDAAAQGYISGEFAHQFISIINTTLKINEATELEQRLTVLEKSLGIED